MQAATPRGERSPLVLLVEDDADLRDLLASVLARDGFEVLEARDGREALELLEKILQRDDGDPPDLVITDHRMPRRSGLDLVVALRGMNAPTPVILITAFGDDAIHERAAALEVVAVLDKPFDTRALLRIARDCTAHAGRGEIPTSDGDAPFLPAASASREEALRLASWPPGTPALSREAPARPVTEAQQPRGPLWLEVLSDESAFARLAPEWRALERGAATAGVFQSFAWSRGLWRLERGRQVALRLLAVRDAGSALVAVLPLALERRRGLLPVRVLRFLGQPLADVQDLLIDPDCDAHAVVSEVGRWLARSADEYDLIDWNELPAHSPLIQFGALSSPDVAAQPVTPLPSSICRVLALPADFDAYLARLSKHFRKNLRRRLRLLQEQFSVSFEIEDGSRDPRGAIADLMQLHQARARATGLRGLFRDPERQAGLAELFQGLLEEGALRIHRLRLDGRVAAADAVLSDRSAATLYIGGFDPDPGLSRYSLGTLNVLEVIRWAIETGHRECDLARGDEPYKQHFRAEARHNQRLLAARSGARGALYRWRERAWLRVTENSALRSLYRSLARREAPGGDGE